MYNLPKPHLSYSSISCWLSSPKTFRKRYYEKSPFFSSPEMAFGKKIGELLEENHESVSHIKRYAIPEQKLQVKIEEVPIFGFLDSFDPDTNSFLEYKTSRVGWDKKKVEQHLQLDIYSLCIEEIFGSVQDECELIWMETAQKDIKTTGLITHEEAHRIYLTGKVFEFPRTITKDDRKDVRDLIVRVAEEISEDYTEYLKKKE